MATSFLVEGRISTSVEKAKALRPIVEKMITFGKRGDLAARRNVISYLFKKEAVDRTFGTISERFKERNGGYTRIVKLGQRFGDGQNRCFLELVDYSENEGVVKQKVKEEAAVKKAEQRAAAANEA